MNLIILLLSELVLEAKPAVMQHQHKQQQHRLIMTLYNVFLPLAVSCGAGGGLDWVSGYIT